MRNFLVKRQKPVKILFFFFMSAGFKKTQLIFTGTRLGTEHFQITRSRWVGAENGVRGAGEHRPCSSSWWCGDLFEFLRQHVENKSASRLRELPQLTSRISADWRDWKSGWSSVWKRIWHTSIFIIQLLENSVILSPPSPPPWGMKQTSISWSHLSLFHGRNVSHYWVSFLSGLRRRKHILSALSAEDSRWLSTTIIWFCDLCPSKHLLMWFYSFIFQNKEVEKIKSP